MDNKHSTTNNIHPSVLLGIRTAAVVGIAVLLLGLVYSYYNNRNQPSQTTVQPESESSSDLAGKYNFVVGTPGPGQQAPSFELISADGSSFNLAALRGKTVLLFFQEGIMCPACWDQIRDIETNFGKFQALGIDQMVSISTYVPVPNLIADIRQGIK